MEFDPFIGVDDLEAAVGEVIADPNSLEVKIALDSACTAVRSYIGQDVNFVAGRVEIHSGSGRKKLRLRQRPVRAVTEVKVDDTVVDSASYSVRDHVITMIDGGVWDHGDDNVQVTYDSGWDLAESSDNNVPADLRLVALTAARRVYEWEGTDATEGAIIKETIGDYAYELAEGAAAAATEFTAPERAILDRYRIELVGDTPTMWWVIK